MSQRINITKTKKSIYDTIDFDNLAFGKHFSDHMFIADYKDGEWQDARIVPFRPKASIKGIAQWWPVLTAIPC